VISGGVAEYFPGVLRALETLSGLRVTTVSEPIFTGALGAALAVLDDKWRDAPGRAAAEAAGALK
jgi:activator of 2-hydroxyglutaryl-CoA dehydratase